jgi:hypothetical protein
VKNNRQYAGLITMAIKEKEYIIPIKKRPVEGAKGSSNLEFLNFLYGSNETLKEGGEPQ